MPLGPNELDDETWALITRALGLLATTEGVDTTLPAEAVQLFKRHWLLLNKPGQLKKFVLDNEIDRLEIDEAAIELDLPRLKKEIADKKKDRDGPGGNGPPGRGRNN